jgi:hypothetical protein
MFITFSKDSMPINFGQSRITCFENIRNFGLIRRLKKYDEE